MESKIERKSGRHVDMCACVEEKQCETEKLHMLES